MRLGRLLAVGLFSAAPLLARAADVPHDSSSYSLAGNVSCQNCHVGHSKEAEAGLLKSTGQANSCNGCHAGRTPNFGFGWNDSDQATPGVGGRHHRWDALATNLGATPPSAATEPEMAQRLDGGKIGCATCHDQHLGASTFRGTPRAGPPSSITVAWNPSDAAQDIPRVSGTGRLQLTSITSTAAIKYYKIKAQGTNAFKVSNDNGTSWFGYSGGTWVADPGGTLPGKPFTLGTAVSIDDPSNGVFVTFQTAPGGTEVWQNFYVSFPFLRRSNADAAMCLVCHPDRNMSYKDVEGGTANGGPAGRLPTITLGTTVFHHPVGEALNANGAGYDRAAPLDADGSSQSVINDGTDTNRTNDLVLGTGGIVTCMTCHAPHNADSNSLSVDQ